MMACRTIAAKRIAPIVAAALAMATLPAGAQEFPNGGRPERDAVTGYMCVSTCDYVRLPDANCICQKLNPLEEDVSKLKLRCSTTRGGHWVACPVKPRYGISVN
jgi:hypothetical protein